MGILRYLALWAFCNMLPQIVNGRNCVVCTHIKFKEISESVRDILVTQNYEQCKEMTSDKDSEGNPFKFEMCPPIKNLYTNHTCGTLSGLVNVTLIGHRSQLEIFHRGCLTVKKTQITPCLDDSNDLINLKSNVEKIFAAIKEYKVQSFVGKLCICDDSICQIDDDSSAISLKTSSKILPLLLLLFCILF
ncbi:uncharacterized protein LOC115216548 [Argonauta hians]